jgi:hypothetical protein
MIVQEFNKEWVNDNPLLREHIKNGYIPGASIIPNWKDIRGPDAQPKQSYVRNDIYKLSELQTTAWKKIGNTA